MKRQHLLFRLFSRLRILPASLPTSQGRNNANMAGSNTGLDNADKITDLKAQELLSQIHDFLIEEYKHASEYSLNTMRDRTQTFNLYVLMLGALSYAFVFLTGKAGIDIKFAIVLLLVYSFINLLNFFRFVTLGINYQESIARMDEIRKYYEQQLKPDALKRIFLVDDKEFISPTRLRPTNRVVCIVYSVLELASLVGAGWLSGGYWLLASVLVAIVFGCVQYLYFHKPWWR